MNSGFSLDRSRLFPVDDTTVLTTTWKGCTPLTSLKLYSIVLSVTTAVICFLFTQLYRTSTGGASSSRWLRTCAG